MKPKIKEETRKKIYKITYEIFEKLAKDGIFDSNMKQNVILAESQYFLKNLNEKPEKIEEMNILEKYPEILMYSRMYEKSSPYNLKWFDSNVKGTLKYIEIFKKLSK